ncbi:DUF1491 family protein [Meridianimarinicoccus sp. MJW13]|uniref:DUF1491 family protein n=1 Tax=Meridianimarinicoccus sp. MJW13 TaxID=2720031 RepID=UPI0037428DE5
MRLAADLWVKAYLRRLQIEHIPAYIAAKGDPTSGAVIVKLATLDGKAVAKQRSYDLMTGERSWMVLAEGPEAEVDAVLARQKDRDRDLWIVEVESREGRDLLDHVGLT